VGPVTAAALFAALDDACAGQKLDVRKPDVEFRAALPILTRTAAWPGPSGAAARLGVPASTLESKIKARKIDKRSFKSA
jgi:hypothetical protein